MDKDHALRAIHEAYEEKQRRERERDEQNAEEEAQRSVDTASSRNLMPAVQKAAMEMKDGLPGGLLGEVASSPEEVEYRLMTRDSQNRRTLRARLVFTPSILGHIAVQEVFGSDPGLIAVEPLVGDTEAAVASEARKRIAETITTYLNL